MEDRAKRRVIERRWREKPENRLKVRFKYMLGRYGLTVDAYLLMVKEQGGVCKICGRPPSDRWNRLHVDHDHATGKVRGLLCHKCNTAMGNFRDDPDLMRKAIEYLEKSHGL